MLIIARGEYFSIVRLELIVISSNFLTLKVSEVKRYSMSGMEIVEITVD